MKLLFILTLTACLPACNRHGEWVCDCLAERHLSCLSSTYGRIQGHFCNSPEYKQAKDRCNKDCNEEQEEKLEWPKFDSQFN